MTAQLDQLRAALTGRYDVKRQVGAGGMATVYLAEDLKHRRQVALKVLKPELAAVLGPERFRREIEIAAQLQHPHILPLHDSGEVGGLLYYVMPYVEGDSLRDRLRREGRLSPTEVAHILHDVADALAHAHARDVVHRDIKPDNVMMSGRHALVTDFGVAKAVSQAKSTSPLTSAGISLGTPTYMAPEQIAADPLVDHRADLYALGVMAYEMLAGKPPFADETPQALLAAHLTEDPTPIGEICPDVPDALADTVMRCLEKQPALRWQRADDIVHALEPFATPTAGAALRAAVRPARRRRLRPLVGGLAVALIVMLAWLGWRAWPAGSGEPRVLAVVPLTAIGDDAETRAFGDGLMEMLASRLTELTRDADPPVWVIPPNEIRELAIGSAAKARAQLNATHAITGSLQRTGTVLRLTLNLVDAISLRQLRSSVIEAPITDVAAWQGRTVAQTLDMIGLTAPTPQFDAPTRGGTRDARAYQLYVQGRGVLQRSDRTSADLATAIEWFTAALAADSTFALAYAGMGEAYWLQYDASRDTVLVGRAMAASQQALALDDSLPDVWATLALIGNGMGQPEDALASAQRALALDPYHTAAQRQMAQAYQRLKRFDDAEQVLTTLTTQQPYYWRGYSTFAFLRYAQGRYPEAAALYARAGELAPGNSTVFRNAGAIYFFLDRWDEAKAMFQRSVDIEPNSSALSNLGTVEYFEGAYASAAERFRQAVALQERDALLWRNLGDALRRLPGQEAEALAAYRRCIELAQSELRVDPTETLALSNLGFAYAVVGEREEARTILERMARDVGTDADLMFSLAQIAEEIGERDVAVGWLVRSLEGGYSLKSIQREPQLAAVRADPRFQAAEQAHEPAAP
jgi:tetratricopeptide (TPR) repeat protein